MDPLLQLVTRTDWKKFRAGYEQAIIDEFGTVPRHDLVQLHMRLEAARDFLDYLERAEHVQT